MNCKFRVSLLPGRFRSCLSLTRSLRRELLEDTARQEYKHLSDLRETVGEAGAQRSRPMTPDTLAYSLAGLLGE